MMAVMTVMAVLAVNAVMAVMAMMAVTFNWFMKLMASYFLIGFVSLSSFCCYLLRFL